VSTPGPQPAASRYAPHEPPDAAPPERPGGLVGRLLLGSRRSIAGTVYGTIVVLGALAAASPAKTEPVRLAVIVAVTVVVLWVAHVYSHGLAESIERGHRLDRAEFAVIARREGAIVLAGVLPIAALVLGGLGVLRESTAIWLAFGAGVATLTVQGVRYARLERLSRMGTLVSVSLNLALGLAITACKVALSH
jgi:hypothetical protein